MKKCDEEIIAVPIDIASRMASYLNEISDVTADIELLLGEKLESFPDFDSDFLKTLQNLDFVRQATADSARLVSGFSLSPVEPVNVIAEKLHLERTVSVLSPETEKCAENKLPDSGDCQIF
ncbi:MAG: hypothetical protein ABJD13_01950 [Paracoccaceae bacterium]